MKDFRPDHRPPQAQQRSFLSLILTIAVHVGLVVFLFFGIRWQSKPLGSLEVGLTGPSAPAPKPPKPEPRPEPPPPPKPEPPPPKPEPPKPEPPPPKPDLPKPDIATKKPEPKQEKPKPPPKPEPKPEKPKPEPKPEKPKPEPKPEPKPLKPIDFQPNVDRAIERNAEEKRVSALMNAGERRAINPGERDAYTNAIAEKIRRNLVVPPGLSGNPEARLEIEQIPSGDVINFQIKQSSGNPALDEAILRAIRKSSPLPLPENRDLFERKVKLTFQPLRQ